MPLSLARCLARRRRLAALCPHSLIRPLTRLQPPPSAPSSPSAGLSSACVASSPPPAPPLSPRRPALRPIRLRCRTAIASRTNTARWRPSSAATSTSSTDRRVSDGGCGSDSGAVDGTCEMGTGRERAPSGRTTDASAPVRLIFLPLLSAHWLTDCSSVAGSVRRCAVCLCVSLPVDVAEAHSTKDVQRFYVWSAEGGGAGGGRQQRRGDCGERESVAERFAARSPLRYAQPPAAGQPPPRGCASSHCLIAAKPRSAEPSGAELS